jgi:hypothetical protein
LSFGTSSSSERLVGRRRSCGSFFAHHGGASPPTAAIGEDHATDPCIPPLAPTSTSGSSSTGWVFLGSSNRLSNRRCATTGSRNILGTQRNKRASQGYKSPSFILSASHAIFRARAMPVLAQSIAARFCCSVPGVSGSWAASITSWKALMS